MRVLVDNPLILLSPFISLPFPPVFLSLSLSQPPSQPNGVIVNYIILYRLDSDTSTNQTATVGSNTTTFTLKNLEKDMIYVVRITAVNSVGQGPFSEGSKALTGSGALMEPDGPVYQRVWFIALMVGVVVVVIIVLVLFVLIVRYKRSHRRSTGKYHGERISTEVCRHTV